MVHTDAPAWMWIAFGVVVLCIMVADLGVFNRKQHVIKTKEALTWVGVILSLAILFGIGLYVWLGHEKALQFYTGYVIELALSVDNIFVFIVIFSYFSVPKEYQHRVLFWGILGAFVLRAVFIFAGTALLERFAWLIYLFGGFLIVTGIRILVGKKDEKVDPGQSPIVRVFRRFVPLSDHYDKHHFMTVVSGRHVATPLLLVLVVVECTDVVFALDSIPAIFAVTTDPFLVYTSNIFAIMGLRNLYFVLADFMDRFLYLKVGLGVVLAFVGVKMVISEFYHMPVGLSLGVIALVLTSSVVVSLLHAKKRQRSERLPDCQA